MAWQAESARLGALDAYGVLDTSSDEAFDRLTGLAADLFDTPIALISLIDAERPWFKSRHGLEVEQTPPSWDFCQQAVDLGRDGLLVIEDATRDPRFSANPLVTGEPHIRFYAGAVLTSADGVNLGTLCVIDTVPRACPAQRDLKRLTALARIVIDELELRRATREARERLQLLTMAERVSGVGHWRHRAADGHVEWSDEIYRIHGVSPTSFAPDLTQALDFVAEEDRAQICGRIAEALRTGNGIEYEMRIAVDGEVRTAICRAECVVSETGEVEGLYGVLQDITSHKQALQALERGREHYKLLADNAADVITGIGVAGRIHYASPAVHKQLGYTPEEVAGRPVQAFVYGPDRPLIAAAFAQMTQGASDQTIQHRALHKSGAVPWLETRLKLICDAAGAPLQIVAVSRDIGERKALEAIANAARERAEEAARRAEVAETAAGLGHWRIDIRTREITFSAHLYRIFGLPQDAPLDFGSLVEMVHPDDRKASGQLINQRLTSAGPAEWGVWRIVRTDGEVRYVAGVSKAEFDGEGNIVARIGTLMDITDQKKAEIAIAESEQRYRRLAVNAPDIIAENTLDGIVTYMSPACLAITGYTPEELVGRDALSMMHPEDAEKVREMCQAVIASKGKLASWSVEYRAFHKAGHEIWMECKPTLATDPVTGRYIGFTDVLRDITARKALEAELRQARAEAETAAAVKGEFLANMSHELRTPLTSILGFTSLTAEQPDLAPLTREYVDKVAEAGRSLLCTVNDILDFSKLEAGHMDFQARPVAFVRLARASLELFTPQAGAKNLGLSYRSDPLNEDLAISIDPDRVRQILLNLIGNAVKFTGAGGVTVKTAYDRTRQILSVDVIDTGPGIPEDKRDMLFKRFSQVDGSLKRGHGGTGLGLAICKGLVEAMGGEIGVDSREGEGSRFWFTIPAPVADLTPASASAGVDHAPSAGLRVLVVDDHPGNRELVHLFLAGIGAEVSEACDGEEAVTLAVEQPYDVILMDVRMPRLDGPGALRRIREVSGPNDATPILAFTADADDSSASRLLSFGFQDVVTKPLDARGLIQAIARATDRAREPAPLLGRLAEAG